MKHSFSTAGWSAGDPVQGWRSWLADELHPVDLAGYDADGFCARCDVVALGDIRTVTFRGSPQAFVRRQAAIRSATSDDYFALVVGTGRSVLDHNGYQANCHGGDIVLIDSGRPYTIAYRTHVSAASLAIPRRHLESRLGATATAVGLSLDGRNASTRVIRSYLRRLARDAEALSPASARRLSLTAIDLIAAGFDEKLARAEPARHRRHVLVVQAQAFIEDKLSDPALGTQLIAACLRVSPRRIHEVFAGEDMSIMDYVWERRLLRARQLLTFDEGCLVPVSSIAYRVGFKTAAHFARRFRRRFGVSASELREKGRHAGSRSP